jgi:hypothetical protein
MKVTVKSVMGGSDGVLLVKSTSGWSRKRLRELGARLCEDEVESKVGLLLSGQGFSLSHPCGFVCKFGWTEI